MKKRLSIRQDDSRRTKLSVRNVSRKSVTVEIFARNPQWLRKGKLAFSRKPLTAGEKGRYHRWKIKVAPGKTAQVQMDFHPAPKPRPPTKKKTR